MSLKISLMFFPFLLFLSSFAGNFDETIMCVSSVGPLPKGHPGYWWTSKERIRELVKSLKDAGVSAVAPEIYGHGTYFYKTSHGIYLKGRVADKLGYDPLAELIKEAHKENMKVIPAMPFLCAGGIDYVTNASGGKIIHEDWLNLDSNGKLPRTLGYDPANPELRKYLCSLVEELASYDIDELMLDYIRYMGPQLGYSEIARKKFKEKYGLDPLILANDPQSIEKPAVYCLKPEEWKTKTYYLDALLMLMNRLGLGSHVIADSPSEIDKVPEGSIILLADCYNINNATVTALDSFLEKGGDVIFINGPVNSMKENEKLLCPMLGLSNNHKYFKRCELSLKPEISHPAVAGIDSSSLFCEGDAFSFDSLTTATALASLSNGLPALTLNRYKNGNVMLLNFNVLIRYRGENGYRVLENSIAWLSSERKMKIYSFLPDGIFRKYPWIAQILEAFFKNSNAACASLKDVANLKNISEDKIRKSIVIYSTFFDPGQEASDALIDYVNKGGNLFIFMDIDVNIPEMTGGFDVLKKYPAFSKNININEEKKFGESVDKHNHAYSIRTLDKSALAKDITGTESEFYGTPFIPGNADVLASFADSMPALFSVKCGYGMIYIFNFGTKSRGEDPCRLFSGLLSERAVANGCIYGSERLANLRKAWDQWRCEQVTELVGMVKETIRKIKPSLPLSAAVVEISTPEKSVFQDWKTWINKGYLDTAHPMDYFDNDNELKAALEWQISGVDPSRIAPFLKIYKRQPGGGVIPVCPEKLKTQIDMVRKMGFRKTGMFCSNYMSDDLKKIMSEESR